MSVLITNIRVRGCTYMIHMVRCNPGALWIVARLIIAKPVIKMTTALPCFGHMFMLR
jgi:hypothetical protein